jgi:Ca-activated chloride channel homolog
MSDWLPALTVREPLWLLLVPLVWAVHRYWRRGGGSVPAEWQAYADIRLLRWLVVEPRAGISSRLELIAWLLIVLAISGPMIADRTATQTRPTLDIAVIIDISPSMRVGDVEPDRLQRTRLELHDLLQRLRSDRVALFAFSAHAYPVLPLTTDLALVPWYLDALDPALTRHQGSNLVPALELAARTLDQAGDGRRAIILLSDGEIPDVAGVLAAGDRLARRDIPVFALGIGTTTGGPVPAAGGFQRDVNDEIVVSRLDRALLAQLAARTGGRYADLRADGSGWDHLAAGIDALARSERTAPAVAAGLPLWPWLLVAGLVLLLAMRVRVPLPATPVIVLATGLAVVAAPPEAGASPWTERAAYEALHSGRYADAEALYLEIDSFGGRLGAGAAAYRAERWADALEWFTDAEQRAGDAAQRATAAYNRANTLARLGRLDDALIAFDYALSLQPNHTRAALNRDIVLRVLARQAGVASDELHGTPREDPDAHRIGAGAAADTRAAGDPVTLDHDEHHAGAGGGAERARVIARPLPSGASQPFHAGGRAGEAAQSAQVRLDAVNDNAAEVLRHRFMLMDAERPRSQEPQPW